MYPRSLQIHMRYRIAIVFWTTYFSSQPSPCTSQQLILHGNCPDGQSWKESRGWSNKPIMMQWALHANITSVAFHEEEALGFEIGKGRNKRWKDFGKGSYRGASHWQIENHWNICIAKKFGGDYDACVEGGMRLLKDGWEWPMRWNYVQVCCFRKGDRGMLNVISVECSICYLAIYITLYVEVDYYWSLLSRHDMTCLTVIPTILAGPRKELQTNTVECKWMNELIY